MSKLAVQLVVWDGMDVLPECLDALARQTFADFELLVMDNGSKDGSAAAIEEAAKAFPRPVRTFALGTNSGFSPAHDALFAMSDSQYVCCVNQDSVPAPDYLELCVSFLEKNPDAGSVSGVLRRPDGSVDSAGLAKSWYGKFIDLRAEPAEPEAPVFGVSGTLPVYRRAAVLQCSPDGKLFDEDYFAYKEDVDLAWRLGLFGWKSFALRAAEARHSRGFGGEKKWDGRHHFRQRLSSRNHLLMLAKDLQSADFWRLPAIFVYESGKAVYTALFAPKALGYLPEFFRLLPRAREARAELKARLRAMKRHG